MQFEAKPLAPTVELSALANGSAFQHSNGFWIKSDTVTAGYITCVNLHTGSVDGFRPNAEVNPQPNAKIIGLTY